MGDEGEEGVGPFALELGLPAEVSGLLCACATGAFVARRGAHGAPQALRARRACNQEARLSSGQQRVVPVSQENMGTAALRCSAVFTRPESFLGRSGVQQ